MATLASIATSPHVTMTSSSAAPCAHLYCIRPPIFECSQTTARRIRHRSHHGGGLLARQRSRLLACRLVRLRLYDDERLQLEEALFADSSDVHEFFRFLEAAVFLPILDDAFRRCAPDPRQILELFERRRIDVHRFVGRGRFVLGICHLGICHLAKCDGEYAHEQCSDDVPHVISLVKVDDGTATENPSTEVRSRRTRRHPVVWSPYSKRCADARRGTTRQFSEGFRDDRGVMAFWCVRNRNRRCRIGRQFHKSFEKSWMPMVTSVALRTTGVTDAPVRTSGMTS
jgi:hypothetical protein